MPPDISFVQNNKNDANLELVLKSISPTGNVRMDQYYFRRPNNYSDWENSIRFHGEKGDGIGTNDSISSSYGRYVMINSKKEHVQIDISSYSYSTDSKEKKEHNIIGEIVYMINNNLQRDGYSYEWSWKKMK